VLERCRTFGHAEIIVSRSPEQDHPDRAVFDATAAVVAALIRASADSPFHWLSNAAQDLRAQVEQLQMQEGGRPGAWARLALAHVRGRMEGAPLCGLAAAGPIEAPLDWGDCGGGIPFGAAALFEPVGDEQHAMEQDLRAARDGAGLAEWARVVVPLEWPDERGYLQVHIDGVRGSSWPRAAVHRFLALIGPACRVAFNARVAEPLRRRQRLLEHLSPAQRERLADLLNGSPEGAIARRLQGVLAVQDHIDDIYRLAVSSRLDLLRLWQAGRLAAKPGASPAPAGERPCPTTPPPSSLNSSGSATG
jgi:hypothetical protein